jgi:hypothetical protein
MERIMHLFRLPKRWDPNPIEENLPAPIEDQEMVKHVGKIRAAIENHTTYYSKDEVAIPNLQNAEEKIVSLLEENGIPETPIPLRFLASHITNPVTRTAAIQYLMSRILLDRIEFDSVLERTLLPAAMAQLLFAFPVPEKDFESAFSSDFSRFATC